MPQRFLRNSTVKVAELIQKAITELANMRRSVVTPELILLALIEQEDSILLKVIDETGQDVEKTRRMIVDRILEHSTTLPKLNSDGQSASIRVSGDVQTLFEAADAERKKLGDTYTSTSAVLLAFYDPRLASVKKMLIDIGLDRDLTQKSLEIIRGNTRVTQKDGESRASILDKYTTDLTALARRGTLDPVIGRDVEIRRVIEILSRRKKNNPILIGEPGVGKTVIAEGLAIQIVSADVPEYLLKTRILSLEIGALIAGAKIQGEFEERLKSIQDEVVASAGDIILFIDEIHTVVGAGRGGGALDASNMLKPALARGLLQCMGATTRREYKQYIESDKALERRFQPVIVGEPSPEQAIQILHGVKTKYENHHQIEYSEEAVSATVRLADRYIQQRCLPDKAIDLLDEAGAAKRIQVIYTPPEMRDKETERADIEHKKIQAFNDRDFETMALHQMQLTKLEEELGTIRKGMGGEDHERLVSEEDIAAIVSQQTGIPLKRMIAAESEKLLKMEDVIGQRVIGQHEAVQAVSQAIRRNRSGIRRGNSPIASFLFLGPTGVGKTELAKALAEQILDDETRIIRLDMSEYMEKHNVSRLIGSPPGYVGYGEGGQLTEQVKHNPYSVILLDEFEKAHPDVYNILLPVLDEGFLTDAEGQKINFQNCIIIGTSNLGSHLMFDRKKPVGIGAQDTDHSHTQNEQILEEVQKFLRPEFINRLDDVIIFHPLLENQLEQILEYQIKDLEKRLKDLHLTLHITESAKKLILEGSNTQNYGARPLKRRLEQLVDNKIASLLIEYQGKKRKNVSVDAKEGDITVSMLEGPPSE